MTVRFVASASTAGAMKALGVNSENFAPPPCPLNTGDFISFPELPALFFRVSSRELCVQQAPGETHWRLVLEKAQNPEDAL